MFDPLTFAALFIGAWAFACAGVARGGWAKLARVYPAFRPPVGVRFRGRSARIGRSGYRHCVQLVASSTGLHAAMAFPFRLAHPPFFIPWEEVETALRWGFLSRVVQLKPRRTSSVVIELSVWLASEIAAASEQRLRLPVGVDSKPLTPGERAVDHIAMVILALVTSGLAALATAGACFSLVLTMGMLDRTPAIPRVVALALCSLAFIAGGTVCFVFLIRERKGLARTSATSR